MNCMLLYIIRKNSIFQTKSNHQIACSANSVSGSAHQKCGPNGRAPTICFKIVMWTRMGLNVNLAEETHMANDI